MANVMFKRGTQASLNTLIKSTETNKYVDGAFYLTTDTDRLYVAQSANELVELNKSITTVANVASLPSSDIADGQFYYALAENILCIYKESGVTGAPKWVQINPDTTDGNDYVKAFSVSKDTTNTDATKLVYNWSMTQADKDGTAIAAHALSGSFEIAASDIVALGGVAVDIDASAPSGTENVAQIAIGGAGADTAATAGKVNIKAGSNVGVSVSGNDITISATDTEFALSSAANSKTIDLKDGSGTAAGSVELKADGTYITADGATAGEIKFSHATQSGVTTGTYGNTGAAIAHENGTIKIPKITVDGAGHITGISAEEFSMPVDNDTTYTAKAATAGTGNDAGKITIGINDGTSDSTATSEKILYNTITVDGTENTVYNTQSLGSFYSASKVDEKLNAVDSMTYKGTVGDTTPASTVASLPSSNVKVGDTYKVSKDGTYASQSAKVGDLFIATGTETSGVITSNLVWTYIPSGADADTTYTFSATSNKITLKNDVSSDSVELTLADDDIVVLGSADNTITASHAASGATAGTYGETSNRSASHGGKIVVPKVVVNATGHVTSASNIEITLPSDNDTTYRLVGNNTTKTITLKDSSNASEGSLTFANGGTTDAITVAMTGNEAATDDAAAENKTLTISHSAVTRTDPTTTSASQSEHGGKFTAVTGVTTNSHGHVTGVATTEFQLPNVSDVAGVADATNNKLGIKYGEDTVGSIQITSNNLSVSSTVAENTNNLVTTIDMVWGSF